MQDYVTKVLMCTAGGWRVRTALAQALFVDPDLLLLVCYKSQSLSILCMCMVGRAIVKLLGSAG